MQEQTSLHDIEIDCLVSLCDYPAHAALYRVTIWMKGKGCRAGLVLH